MIGAIPRSGQIPLTRDLRVLEAIAMVGGFALFANTRDVRIVRRQPDGNEVEFRFDYKAYIKGRAPGTNIVLESGDTLPREDTIEAMVSMFRVPAVGMTGAQKVAVNTPDHIVGVLSHLRLKMEHQLCLEIPRLGELIAAEPA